MLKNSATKLTVYCWDATTGLPKTGDAANLTAYVSLDFDASPDALTDTSATEVDSTNAKGFYRFDLTAGETNGDINLYTCKSSTSNIVCVCVPALVHTLPTTGVLAPATAGRTLVVDAAGLADANAVKVGPSGSGTPQTARDIGASVLLSSGTGTGQVKLSSGYIAPNWGDVGNPTTTVGLSGTTVGTLTTYTGNTPQTGDAYARLGAPAGASVSADVAAVKVDTGNLVTRITSTLFSGITSLANWLGALAGKAADSSTQTEIRATTAGAGYTITTDSLEAIRDRGDAAWITATGFSTHTAADVWAVATRVLTAATNITSTGGTITVSTGAVTVGTNNDKAGYALSASGLDSIAATDPGGVATTWPQMMVQLWRRMFRKSTLTATELKTYADDGTTVRTTQTVSDDGTTQTQGTAS